MYKHLFSARNALFYSFGASKQPIYANALNWDLHADPKTIWAVTGPSANTFLSSTLLGRARASPIEGRRWPFLEGKEGYLLDQVIQRVAFKTRLEARGPSVSGEFTDYTSRYGGLREEDRLTLFEHLQEYLQAAGLPSNMETIHDFASRFEMSHLLPMPLVALSNGQTRRARVVRALLAKPELLVLEEPFTGLDVHSRDVLSRQLTQLHQQASPAVILSLRLQDGIPSFITHLIQLAEESGQLKIRYVGPREGATDLPSSTIAHPSKDMSKGPADPQPLVELKNVSIVGRTPILQNVNWVIREGEKWRLKGPNGSGKSTILSLLTGDHPRSFSESVTLFGKPRSALATVKLQEQIGHTSPEIYNAFPRRHGPQALTAREAIATGYASIFSYRKITPEQSQQLTTLADRFQLSKEWLDTPFAELSAGDQSLVLFLRALVKKPKLLILDEAFAGMTGQMVERCRTFVDEELDERQAVIFVSHYDDEVPSSVTKTLALESGRVVEKSA